MRRGEERPIRRQTQDELESWFEGQEKAHSHASDTKANDCAKFRVATRHSFDVPYKVDEASATSQPSLVELHDASRPPSIYQALEQGTSDIVSEMKKDIEGNYKLSLQKNYMSATVSNGTEKKLKRRSTFRETDAWKNVKKRLEGITNKDEKQD